VYRDLKQAIEMYLEYVASLPEGERDGFLKRRAPLSMRLRFLWFAVRSFLLGRGGKGEMAHAEFLLPCEV
jgi:hypothetical protein